jgi:hypothetical protein
MKYVSFIKKKLAESRVANTGELGELETALMPWGEGLVGRGFNFTYNPNEASGYALNDVFGKGDSPNVVPAYVSVRNPLIITHGVLPDGRKVTDLTALVELGFDRAKIHVEPTA